MLAHLLTKIYRWRLALAAGLTALLLALLWISPAESTLGQTVKLVYLHGALVRTAIVLLVLSLPVNLVGLISGRAGWLAWGRALAVAALLIWLGHTLVSMITTYATWGVFIAWFEPRTRFTFNLAFVAVLVLAVDWLMNNRRFSALAFGGLAAAALALLPNLGFVQHPLDPIGQSTSGSIHLFYTAILVVSLGLGGLLALWLGQPDSTEAP